MIEVQKKAERKVMTGNYAVAYAAKLSRVKVVSAYPITPQTSIVEKLSEFIERGELDARIIRVESEHSALAAVYGAAVAGARAFTATSSQGLLYMHEWVHWFSRSRIPAVMAVVTRAISPPWNIWPDHSDFMDQRDAGWIMSFGMDNQEVLDLVIQAFKISEDPRVYLPVMVGLEGFILGGTAMPVELPAEEEVSSFLGDRRQPYSVTENSISIGNMALPEDYEKMQMEMQKAISRAKDVIKEVDAEYGRIFGRSYGGLVSCYKCENSDFAVVTMGAWSGDAMEAVDLLRNEGINAGLLRIRYVRPFPKEEIRELLLKNKLVLVFDRSISFGSFGPLFEDVAASSINIKKKAELANVIAGLGGVNVTTEDFVKVMKRNIEKLEAGEEIDQLQWYHSNEVMSY